jgi:hypothetical protein
MGKDDLMRTVVDMGRSQEIWTDSFDTASGEFSVSLPHGGSYQIVVMRVSPLETSGCAKKTIRYGLMKDKLKNWSYDVDRALDEEVGGMFECLKENV